MLKLLGGLLGNVLDGELLFGGLYVSCIIFRGCRKVEDELLEGVLWGFYWEFD